MEVGLLRRILKRAKLWNRLADDVAMLPENPREARVLAPGEKATLSETARLRPEWVCARCAAILALNTTIRSCELRGLRLGDVNLFAMVLTIRTTKTDAGKREIPLNRDAVLALGELIDRLAKLGADKLLRLTPNGSDSVSSFHSGWR
jgi:integrase